MQKIILAPVLYEVNEKHACFLCLSLPKRFPYPYSKMLTALPTQKKNVIILLKCKRLMVRKGMGVLRTGASSSSSGTFLIEFIKENRTVILVSLKEWFQSTFLTGMVVYVKMCSYHFQHQPGTSPPQVVTTSLNHELRDCALC